MLGSRGTTRAGTLLSGDLTKGDSFPHEVIREQTEESTVVNQMDEGLLR